MTAVAGAFSVTATFSEYVQGLLKMNHVSNASVLSLTGSGAVYTIVVNPTGGTPVSVSIDWWSGTGLGWERKCKFK